MGPQELWSFCRKAESVLQHAQALTLALRILPPLSFGYSRRLCENKRSLHRSLSDRKEYGLGSLASSRSRSEPTLLLALFGQFSRTLPSYAPLDYILA